jgi:hypothetical protein
MNKSLLASLFLAIMIIGCSDSSLISGESAAPTPEKALHSCFYSMFKMEKNNFIECFYATQKERLALSAIIDYGVAAKEFRDKFIAAYGEQAWNNFQDPKKAPKESDARFRMFLEQDFKKLDFNLVKVKEGTATFYVENENRNIELIKTNNGWLMVASKFLRPGVKAEDFGNLMANMTKVTSKYMKAIGYKGIAPEDIDAELGRAWASEIGFSFSTEHRFNIDKL